jgi:predicted RNA-binding protein with PIN domain
MNVIGSRPDGWWRDRRGAMRSLAASLGEYAQATGDEVTVFFDGRSFDVGDPGVTVRFAGSGARDAADDVIVEAVAADSDPADLTVVTSDAALAERVRSHGAAVLAAGRFRRALPEPR